MQTDSTKQTKQKKNKTNNQESETKNKGERKQVASTKPNKPKTAQAKPTNQPTNHCFPFSDCCFTTHENVCCELLSQTCFGKARNKTGGCTTTLHSTPIGCEVAFDNLQWCPQKILALASRVGVGSVSGACRSQAKLWA